MRVSLTEETFQGMLQRYPELTKDQADYIFSKSFFTNQVYDIEYMNTIMNEGVFIHVPDFIVYGFWCHHDINIDHHIKLYPNADGVLFYLTEVSNHGE